MKHRQLIHQQEAVLELKAKEIMESENTWQNKYFELHKLIIMDRGLKESDIILGKIEGGIYE